MRITISEGYRRLNTELRRRDGPHKAKERIDGLCDFLRQLVTKCDAKSILDYGCGDGLVSRQLGEIVRNYDPAVKKYAADPWPADIVVCSHVLEHVEPEYLDNVLDHLRDLTVKRVVLIVPNFESRQVLPDGRNAHLTVKPWAWWEPKLRARWKASSGQAWRHVFYFIGKPLGG